VGGVKIAIGNYWLFESKEIKRRLMIITATVLVILSVVLLTLHLHHKSKMEVLSQFQDHQLAYAQHLADQIEFFFHARSQELQALSSLVSRESGDLKKKKGAIETYSKMMEYVKTISLCMMIKAQELSQFLCLRKGGDESYLNHSTFRGEEIRLM
jgi:hypothetical protein